MSTSKLQRLVAGILGVEFGDRGIEILENVRPRWLVSRDGARLELDFLIPKLQSAIEVQGKQHFVYTPFFHQNSSGYHRRLEYDQTKKAACVERDITLFEICCNSDVDPVVCSLQEIATRTLTEFKYQAKIKHFGPKGELRKILGALDSHDLAIHNLEIKVAKCSPDDNARLLSLEERLHDRRLEQHNAMCKLALLLEASPPSFLKKLRQGQGKKKRKSYRKRRALPGNQRTRQRAKRLLQVELLTPDGLWKVWGGQSVHLVWGTPHKERDGTFEFACDCSGWQNGFCCSHVLAVWYELNMPNLERGVAHEEFLELDAGLTAR